MMIYVINVLLIILYALIFLKMYRKPRLFCVLCFLQLFLIAAFRYDVGPDYMTYKGIYLDIGAGVAVDYSWLSPVYVILNKLIFMIAGEESFWMFAAFSFLTIFFIIQSIYKSSCDVFMSVFLYVSCALYIITFPQLRQTLALAIVVFSYRYIRDKKLSRFIICIVIATLFHYSAAVFVIVYFVRDIKITKRNVAIYALVVVSSYFFSDLIIRLVSLTVYGGYIGSIYSSNVGEMGNSVVLNSIFRFLLMVGTLFFSKKVLANDSRINILYNCGFLCFLFQILALRLSTFGRISAYFYIFYIFLIPEVVQSIKNKNMRSMVYGAVLVVFSAYHYVYYTFLNASSNNAYVYKAIFNSFGY